MRQQGFGDHIPNAFMLFDLNETYSAHEIYQDKYANKIM